MPPSSVRYVELEITTEEDMLLYRTTFCIDGKGGIYSMALPANAGIPALETGKAYRWALYVYCQSDDETLDPAFNFGVDLGRANVSSYISREPDRSTRSATWTEQVKADLPDFWLDALNTLLTQYCQDPRSATFAEQWKQALSSIGLPELADEPIRVTCPPQP
jgi:hypothetical protein